MSHIVSKLHLFLKLTIYNMLLLCPLSLCFSQSKFLKLTDSVVVYAFNGDTNDNLFWDKKKYFCSYSPLSVFRGYDSLYIHPNIICENSYENISDDKQYSAIWVIVDNYLYLCDIKSVCEEIYPCFKDYIEAYERNISLGEQFLIKMFPLEKLIGQKFQKKFPTGIYNAPLSSGYVIAAEWFNGAIDIKPESTDYFDPYLRLVFKKGKIISTQKLIYYR